MNIFLILLMSIFMAGYYMMFSPGVIVREQETEYAVSQSDLRSVAECALALHNAQISGQEFHDICTEQNGIVSEYICLDARLAVTSCEGGRGRRPVYSFLITRTDALRPENYSDMMDILERNFATTGTFGIYQDGVVLAGGTTAKRAVPESIQKKLNLEDGQLVYMTQYDAPDSEREYTNLVTPDIVCPAGSTRTYRFGRWQCIGYNMKTSCGGDMVWDSDVMECVPDESRKPLCAGNQTAVIVDDVWECINPFAERQCPNNMVARLNYETLEWECIEDANKAIKAKKCDSAARHTVRGRSGATVRLSTTSCTDCEQMILDEATCTTICVPDVTKLSSPSCYPGKLDACSGASRAIYFGFPNLDYAQNVPEISEAHVPFDSIHSQNRRFNCLDCGSGTIDVSRSVYPYTAVCTK